jgi:hypothetical protein
LKFFGPDTVTVWGASISSTGGAGSPSTDNLLEINGEMTSIDINSKMKTVKKNVIGLAFKVSIFGFTVTTLMVNSASVYKA